MKNPTNNGYSNRVVDAICFYAEQEAQFMINNPLESRYNLQEVTYKLQYYGSIYNKIQKTANADEKLSLRYLRHEIAKMNARLNPTFLNRMLYSTIANAIRNFVNGNNLLYARLDNNIKDIQRNLIQEHNLNALSAAMKKAGFKSEIEGALRKMIDHDLPQFHIRYSDVHYPKTDFVLHFQKAPNTDLYYFDKFEAISRPSLDALLNDDPSCRRHTFSLLDKMDFTGGEAANLVNGKCVCKNINGKETWLFLDATTPNRQHAIKPISFNLEKTMERLPIKEKENPSQYQALLQALKAGNSKEVTFIINGSSVKYTIDVAPSRKMIDVLDKNGRLVDLDRLKKSPGTEQAHQLIQKIKQLENEVIDLGEAPKSKLRV